MIMISEFVKELREKSTLFSRSDFAVAGVAKDYKEAADIIEELSAKLASANMERSEQYYKDVSGTNIGKWIPVSDKLPENTDPVNITWVNHKPEPYYEDIKDKPFTATACYCDGKWYWYSAVCQDYLDEYRYSENDYMDNGIEVIAWMPLPEPHKGEYF